MIVLRLGDGPVVLKRKALNPLLHRGPPGLSAGSLSHSQSAACFKQTVARQRL